MRVYSIGSLLVFLAVWVLLFVSFVNPWYQYTQNYIASDGEEYRNYVLHFYPTNVKILTANLTYNNEKYSYKELINTDFWITNIPLNFLRYIRSSIAFSVLGFFVTTGLVALTFLDMYDSEKRWLVVGKYLGFVVFVFTFLSFILYIVFKSQFNKDCESKYSSLNMCDYNGSTKENSDDYGFFNGKFVGSSKLSSWGPLSGWNCVVIASAVSLLGSIYNVIFFNKK